MRKESALVLFKPSVLNFFEEYYFKVTTSSYRTLGIVCLHTDTKQCHIFHFTHSGWCRSLGENASNLFCSNVPEEWSFLHFITCKKPGISWQLILDIIVYDSSTLECELISSQWNVYFIKTLECRLFFRRLNIQGIVLRCPWMLKIENYFGVVDQIRNTRNTREKIFHIVHVNLWAHIQASESYQRVIFD